MKIITKKISYVSFFTSISLWGFILTLLFSGVATAEVIDRVVAEVNDSVITLSEVDEEGAAIYQRIIREVPPEQRMETLAQTQQEVLDGLIDKTLIAQEAEKMGVTVSEEELDSAVGQVMANNNVNAEEFAVRLQQDGLTESIFRENLRSQIYQNKLVNLEVRSKIVITEDMILDYYDTQYTSKVSEGSYYLLQIGTSWEDEGEEMTGEALQEAKDKARTKAERVHKLARSGQDFRDLARRFSDLPSAADGGDLGVFAEDEMAGYMRDAVTSLRAGEVSPIVETPIGYQFFMLLSSNEGGIVMQAPYDSVKEEIRERLFQENMQKEFDSWITGVRERAYIRKL